LAIGKPSRVVMIEAGVPGMRSRVAVINPPLTEPTYMATNKAKAVCGSMPKVNGTTSEMAMAPVRPGTAPTNTPATTPKQIQIRIMASIRQGRSTINQWVNTYWQPNETVIATNTSVPFRRWPARARHQPSPMMNAKVAIQNGTIREAKSAA